MGAVRAATYAVLIAGMLLACLPAVATAGPASAASPATTVHRPAGKAPLRYRDEVFARVDVVRGIRYGSAPGADGRPVLLTLDLYRPVGDRARRRPAFVWAHGGGFSSGDSSDVQMSEAARAFAARGYVAVSINYRLLNDGSCERACRSHILAAQHDAQAAVRWLRSRERSLRIDTRRIGIGGSSAGAVTALLVGTRPNDPGDSGNPGERSSVRTVASMSGGLPFTTDIGRTDAPTLFFHSSSDMTVPYAWARDDAAAFASVKVPVVLETLPGSGHVPWDRYGARFVKHSAWFAYQQLGLARLPAR